MDALTLLRGCLAYTSGRCDRQDVLIAGERIAAVGADLSAQGRDAMWIDASGLVLSPGFVDLHVHLREPGFTQKETIATGTMAAAAGGFTTICAMPNLDPVPDTPEHLGEQLALIERDALVEVLPYGAITMGQMGRACADLEGLAPYVIGFSDDGKGVADIERMQDAMKRAKALNRFISAHCEDTMFMWINGVVHEGVAARRFHLTPISSASEWRQAGRDLELAAEIGCRYHICHISTRETVQLLRRAKALGVSATGECTPHHLALCDGDIDADDGRFKMNPPLRSAEDRDALLDGLMDGTIDCIATDHAPHTADEKTHGLMRSAFGIVGLETALGVCYETLVAGGHMTLEDLIERMAVRPARILGRRAEIAPGAPANLVLIDPSARWRVNTDLFHSMGRSTPFAGRTLTGQVVATWYRGKKVYDRNA